MLEYGFLYSTKLIFGTVLVKITFQRLALSYITYMEIILNYTHASIKYIHLYFSQVQLSKVNFLDEKKDMAV